MKKGIFWAIVFIAAGALIGFGNGGDFQTTCLYTGYGIVWFIVLAFFGAFE